MTTVTKPDAIQLSTMKLVLVDHNEGLPSISFSLPPRDGEDLDELLERQADMIRYLQQHNANLGRRILELQAQAME